MFERGAGRHVVTLKPPSCRRRMPALLSHRQMFSAFAPGTVSTTVPFKVTGGSGTPRDRQNDVQAPAPAAQSTTDVLIVPCSVTTADTRPDCVSIPRTAQAGRIDAPFRSAARAIAGAGRRHAGHDERVDERAVVEAFPTWFLGVMVQRPEGLVRGKVGPLLLALGRP